MQTSFPCRVDARLLLALLVLSTGFSAAREPRKPPPDTQTIRARALGIPFDGMPGPLNAITDVAGVTVGYTTLNEGEGKLDVGKGPTRTGVTAILPRGGSHSTIQCMPASSA